MALFHTRTAAVYGVDAHRIDVEVDLYPTPAGANGNIFTTVGMPDTAVRESRDRIKSALQNSQLGFPNMSLTINLAPADLRKEGTGFDLPMAIGILGATGKVASAEQYLIAGELSLDGGVRPVRGALSMAVCARKSNIPAFIVPADNAREASVVEDVRVYGVKHISEVVSLLSNPENYHPVKFEGAEAPGSDDPSVPDFRDVRGQQTAKRALEVAAAGGHNVLMIGPPGSGKTMLAKRLAGILPPLMFDEALETTQVHSVAGALPKGAGLLTARPFRAPHHTISEAGLIGGGMGVPHPGEVSLAHHGVLFLDELPEFPRNVLELLRQPLEDRNVTIARSTMTLTFPSSFMLISGMNPCPCGFLGDATRECRCTGAVVQRYLNKISGPLLDRIDLHIEVPAVPYKEIRGEAQGASTAEIRARVEEARAIQRKRGYYNSQLPTRLLRQLCLLDDAGERTLEMAMRRFGLSARAHDRILKVARTIADLDKAESVNAKHLAEAVQYRSLDRNYWT